MAVYLQATALYPEPAPVTPKQAIAQRRYPPSRLGTYPSQRYTTVG